MVCACLASYTPAAGDRVFFQRVGGAMLVLGKI
uniref:DNA binding protein n=1 Tax=Siphoviridae sp. cth2082 TaxID=2826422 RepID=A0A8S5MW94_9CAUD|nr:MAG TPA: DNA binding protein [Siphoviridae sp. cth2082]